MSTPEHCPKCHEVTSGRCVEHSGPSITYYGQGQTPHRCPVCQGKGAVPAGFYDHPGAESWVVSDTTPEPCRACCGTGVVWR